MVSVNEVKIQLILNFVFSAITVRLNEMITDNSNSEDLLRSSKTIDFLRKNPPNDLIVKVTQQVCDLIIKILKDENMTNVDIVKKVCENLKIESKDTFQNEEN